MKTANLALMISITSGLAWGGYSAEGSIRELLGFRAETIPEFHTSNTKDVQETAIQKITNAHGTPRGERDNAKSPSKSAHLAPLFAGTPYAFIELEINDRRAVMKPIRIVISKSHLLVTLLMFASASSANKTLNTEKRK